MLDDVFGLFPGGGALGPGGPPDPNRLPAALPPLPTLPTELPIATTLTLPVGTWDGVFGTNSLRVFGRRLRAADGTILSTTASWTPTQAHKGMTGITLELFTIRDGAEEANLVTLLGTMSVAALVTALGALDDVDIAAGGSFTRNILGDFVVRQGYTATVALRSDLTLPAGVTLVNGILSSSNATATGTFNLVFVASVSVGGTVRDTAETGLTLTVGVAGMALTTVPASTPWQVAASVEGQAVAMTFGTGGARVGRYADEGGTLHVHVMTDVAGSLTAMTPASGDVAGYPAYGLDVNPLGDLAGNNGQGWDGLIGTYPGTDTAVRITHEPARNKHPSVAGPLAWAAGDKFVAVMCLRRANLDPAAVTGGVGDDDKQVAGRFVTLVFGPSVPAAGAYRPGSVDNANLTPIVRASQIDVTKLPNLTAPAGLASQAACLAANAIDANYGWTGETQQRINLFEFPPGGGTGVDNYLGQAALNRADVHHRLLCNVSQADKEALIPNCITRANDLVGLYLRGLALGDGAGQHFARHNDLLIAHKVTGLPIYLAAARFLRAGTLTSAMTVAATDLDLGVSAFPAGAGQGNRYQRPWMQEHVGTSAWIDQSRADSSTGARYWSVVYPVMIAEGIVALVLTDADGTPYWDLLEDGPHPLAGAMRASIDKWFVAYAQGSPNRYGGINPPARHLAAWAAWLPLSTREPASEVPPMLDVTWTGDSPSFGNTAIRMSAGAGTIGFNLTDFAGAATAASGGFSPRAVTAVDYFVTIGAGIQKFLFPNKGFNPTLAEVVPGVPFGRTAHRGGWALVNAIGRALWSPTHRWNSVNSGNDRSRDPRIEVTPSGVPANSAPAIVVAPLLHYNASPNWPGQDDWRPLSGAELARSVGVLGVGSGYPSGFPFPTVAYRVQRNTNTEASPTWLTIYEGANPLYDVYSTPDNLGKQLRGGANWTNSQGESGWSYTAAIRVPAKPALAANRIMETEFGPDWPAHYPLAAAGVTFGAGSATLAHSKYSLAGMLATLRGLLSILKNGTSAFVRVPMSPDQPGGVLAAGVYRASIKAPVGVNHRGQAIDGNNNGVNDHNWSAAGTFSVSTDTGTVLATTSVPANVADEPYLYEGSLDFTVPAGGSTARISLTAGTGGTGGTTGAHPVLSRLELDKLS